MAFGITRKELAEWKEGVARGELAFLTHFWYDPRFPEFHSVTKVGCSDMLRLSAWCEANGLNPRYIHHRDPFPHYDLIGPKQKEILQRERLLHHLERFKLV